MALLRLGVCDKGSLPTNKSEYFSTIHSSLTPGLRRKNMFRDESQWRSFAEIPGTEVQDFQEFLISAGFLPNGKTDGVYGYRTRAAARLFQEYVRSVEKVPSIGTPDGLIGSGSMTHVKRWKDNNLKSDWGNASVSNQSTEFSRWMNILKTTGEGLKTSDNEILKLVNNFSKTTDTKKVAEWQFKDDDVHLLGIRRGLQTQVGNNDVFILLINGMVFKFWGSCEPNPKMIERNDPPFLVEGQHVYRIGFHKISNVEKAYMALKPATNGVLVFRGDRDNLKESDIKRGLKGPNNTINIHWSGVGSFNFSAGCQVIAGKSYINHKDEVVDCSKFASKSYAGMKKKRGVPRKTKGAYNVIADLVAVYAPKVLSNVHYTLGRDSTLNTVAGFDKDFAKNLHKRMTVL